MNFFFNNLCLSYQFLIFFFYTKIFNLYFLIYFQYLIIIQSQLKFFIILKFKPVFMYIFFNQGQKLNGSFFYNKYLIIFLLLISLQVKVIDRI
jgi:hypothetical protein